MARGSSSSKRDEAKGEMDPEIAARKRLKKLAFNNNILSETQAKPQAYLSPSATVLKHHGKDIVKKSQRKNRFLFSFSGLLAPVSGGKIGELKDLGTKNPILYLDFPQGRLKLFGTIVYPKNRYLTLQFSRGGKNVMCEDCFDNMTEVVSVDSEDKDAVERPRFLEGNKTPISKSKNGSRAKGNAQSGNRGLLVQPTLPSLFKKVEEKRTPRSSKRSSTPKVSAQKMQLSGSKQKIDQDEGLKKRRVVQGQDDGGKFRRKDTEYEDEDDIEELSSSQEDTDEDWTS
ncbi:DNA-binding protein RHL1, partial [Cucurbita argyrosperma subsp. sororia]